MASTKGKAILPNGEELEVQVVFEKKTEPTFTKVQLLKAKRYGDKRDALNAVLDAEKTYSHKEVEAALEKFYKGGNK